ncbi:hypothetical protein L798_07706 [Zootermopsis nevadensis]|uniref:Uncharacterized protein n=1 Tax=Zootermopsis nevadensis TaxID=136037 RepID=A0A067R5Q6_ZOONE|nr:hypothetical protein L798_07706 [Zootermopsis nevadensis]
MSFEEHDTEDLQPRTAPCRSSSFQPCIAPSVPEVSLIFNSGSSVNTGTSATAARGLHHETSATERRNVKSVSNAGYHEVLKYGTYPSSHHEGNKLPHCSSHKPDEILGAVKLDNINCPSTAVLRDNRNVESEVITNSKRTFLPRTFSNRCNSFDKNIDGTQQNYCAHDSSVTNRKPDRLAYQQNGSQNSHESKKSMSLKNNQNNDGDRSVWNENNGYRNFYGSAYHSKPGVEKCRMEKSYYKRYQKKNYPQRKFPSDTENEGRSSLCCHKEASSPLNYAHQQMTCVSPDPSCIPEERTAVDYLRSRQDSVANDQTSVVIPLSPSTLFSREQEKDRDTKTSSDPVFRHKNDFNSLFLADQPTNRNLETRIDATNHIQSVNFRDTSEGVDTFKVQSANMKEAGSHDDSSMFDLYNLVRSQNEQLKHLQTQVDRLLLMRDRNSTMSTTACCCPPFTCAGIQSAKQNITVVNASTQTMVTDSRCDIAVNTDSRPVVSVAVMTSFADTADSKQSQKMERMTRLRTCSRKQ